MWGGAGLEGEGFDLGCEGDSFGGGEGGEEGVGCGWRRGWVGGCRGGGRGGAVGVMASGDRLRGSDGLAGVSGGFGVGFGGGGGGCGHTGPLCLGFRG